MSIDLRLVDPCREFNFGTPDGEVPPINRDHIPLGSVFEVNRQTVNSRANIETDVLPGATLQLPDPWGDRYQPMLFTTINIYQKHTIKEHDFRLTCPRLLTTADSINAGDLLRGSYLLGDKPHLSFQRVNQAKAESDRLTEKQVEGGF